MHQLPDGSGFFIVDMEDFRPLENPICWNPYNKVVQDHRDGTIHHDLTNVERTKRGLAVPWEPSMADREVREPAIQ